MKRNKENKLRFNAAKDPYFLEAEKLMFASLGWYAKKWLETLQARNYSDHYIKGTAKGLHGFFDWLDERGVKKPSEVSSDLVLGYQKQLFRYRKADGKPLAIRTQSQLLSFIRSYFKWLKINDYIDINPTLTLELPRAPKLLPRNVLSIEQVEKVLSQPNTKTIFGLRDRAILEVFYSTGIRRLELCNLSIYDIDQNRLVVMIREGKGKKDRVIPIGKRAVMWVNKYLNESRPKLLQEEIIIDLFLNYEGDPLHVDCYSRLVRKYVIAAKIIKKGSCHMLRHTAATLMHEAGADIRYIQEMLGHANLSTTEIYTRVSIKKLQEVHTKTHPGKMKRSKKK